MSKKESVQNDFDAEQIQYLIDTMKPANRKQLIKQLIEKRAEWMGLNELARRYNQERATKQELALLLQEQCAMTREACKLASENAAIAGDVSERSLAATERALSIAEAALGQVKAIKTRKRSAKTKHERWREMREAGLSYGEIAMQWKAETNEVKTPDAVMKALKRDKTRRQEEAEDVT